MSTNVPCVSLYFDTFKTLNNPDSLDVQDTLILGMVISESLVLLIPLFL